MVRESCLSCPRTRRHAVGGVVVVLGLLLSPVSMSGCYQRVVSASGPGTEGYTIHDPASEAVMFKRFDRWIMGEPDAVKHKRR